MNEDDKEAQQIFGLDEFTQRYRDGELPSQDNPLVMSRMKKLYGQTVAGIAHTDFIIESLVMIRLLKKLISYTMSIFKNPIMSSRMLLDSLMVKTQTITMVFGIVAIRVD